MPEINLREKRIYQLFEVSVVIKGIDALAEIVLGFLLIFTNVVNTLIIALTQDELIEDPNDFFATHLRALASSSHEAQVFGGLYLVGHGIVKVVLVGGLLRKKVWAYPAAITFLILFILYQSIDFLGTHSTPLLLLTLFDLLLLWLVWHEYRRISVRSTRT